MIQQKQYLTDEQIDYVLQDIEPVCNFDKNISNNIYNNIRNNFVNELKKVQVYPDVLDEMRNTIRKQYYSTQVSPGESVGVLTAQSIGERQTQLVLNSVDYTTKLLLDMNGNAKVVEIGKFIDDLLQSNTDKIQHIPENRTEYLELSNKVMVPSCDENGNTDWYRIEAITRHLPVGKLVKVKTQMGREVVATQQKSFLRWNGSIFESTNGSDLVVGDILPTTHTLRHPDNIQEYLDMSTIFSKNEYIYSSEIEKALKYKYPRRKNWWRNNIGIKFILPYKRSDSMPDMKDFKNNCIYLKSGKRVSHIPDKIPLDNDFGFFIGLYLGDGWVTKTFLGISNNDTVIRKRITDYCDRYGVTYHLVTSKGKNVRNGTSNDLKIHSVMFARLFKYMCDTGSANKRVPEFAYTAPTEFIKGLLNGYISGDGAVNKSGSIVITSVSENLLLGIQFLLTYFGVIGKLSSHQVLKNNVGSKNIKRTYNLDIRNGFAQTFANEIQLTESRKQEKLTVITLEKDYRYEFGQSQQYLPIDRHVYFDKVVSIEYVEGTTEYVYDLTVEKTRCFQGWNGITYFDTFHSSGITVGMVVEGVPRFSELLNATKNPKNVFSTIYFKDDHKTIDDLRETIGSLVVQITFENVLQDYTLHSKSKHYPKWYTQHKLLYPSYHIQQNKQHYISCTLNLELLYKYKINLQDIANIITDTYDDLSCIWSPDTLGILHIWMDTDDMKIPESEYSHITDDNKLFIYTEDVVVPNLSSLKICGIDGIHEIYYKIDNGVWYAEALGFNLKQLFALRIIDATKTFSNHMWEISEVLGIEATREFLVNEFMSVVASDTYINKRHVLLLVDVMLYTGSISSISRYGVHRNQSGALTKSSFEESLDQILKAGIYGENEDTTGVSAAIMCGKVSNVGSGLCDLIYNV